MKDLNATAHKILDVAERNTQMLGFNAFSYKDLQREVGVKTSSIHYYFPTKADLARCLVERYQQRFDQVLADITTTEDSGLSRLRRLGDVHLSLVAEDRFCMCGMMASDALSLPESVTKQLTRFFNATQAWIEDAIDLAKEQGEVKLETKSSSAALLYLTCLEGGMLVARMRKEPAYLKAAIDESICQLQA